MLMVVATVIITVGDIIMMSIGIKNMRGTKTIIAKSVIVSVAENIIVMAGRTGKIILRIGPTGHTFILVLVEIMTDLITDAGTRDTIAMITINKDTDIIDTNTMAESIANVVKVS